MKRIQLLTFVLFCWSLSFAQEAIDSASTTIDAGKSKSESNSETVLKKKNPTTAGLLSAALPGLGQAYNSRGHKFPKGSLWKIPVIYALEGYFIYNVRNYNKSYQKFRRAVFERQDDSVAIEEEYYQDLIGVSEANLSTQKDFYRRQRDANVIYAIGIYAINIVDAIVDAHLSGFEVNKNLGMSVEPAIFGTDFYASAIGMSVTLNFKQNSWRE